MSIPSFPSSSPTARPLKYFLWIIMLCALAGSLLQKSGIPVQTYLGLSRYTLTSGFVWTLLTYPFTYPGSSGTLEFTFYLAIDLFLLWVFGRSVIERTGGKRFFILFFGSTLFGGLAAAASVFLFPRSPFGGLSAPLLAIFTAWFMFQSEQESRVVKPIWIFLILVVGNLALNAIAGLWVRLIAESAAVLYGYAFCLISEKIRSPFTLLQPFEKSVLRALERAHSVKKPASPKIIDFKTGEPVLDDDQFMDAMLSRISLYGEDQLKPDEKRRMKEISERKASKKK